MTSRATRRPWATENGITAANVDTLHGVWSIETPGLLSEPMVSVTFVDGWLRTGSFSHDTNSSGGSAVCIAEQRVLDPVTGGQFGIGDLGYPSGPASSGGVVARGVLYTSDGTCVAPSVAKLEVDGATLYAYAAHGTPVLAKGRLFVASDFGLTALAPEGG